MSEQHADFYEAHAEHISEVELRHLKEHDPTIEYRLASAEGISQGRQSRVSVLEYERGGETFSVLWKRMGAEKGLTMEEASEFDSRLSPYRQSLTAAGWNVPKLLYHRVCEMPGEYQVFSYEQFIPGGDGESMYANPEEPNFRKWYLMEEVVGTLGNYPQRALSRQTVAGEEATVLPHGLDLKLANYVLERGTNELYFVDLFGPKELNADGEWLTYSPKLDSLPEDNLKAVCATREGAILRCWRLAEQHWPNAGRSAADLTAEFIEHLQASNLPGREKQFIGDQIQQGYPWLERIYQERAV